MKMTIIGIYDRKAQMFISMEPSNNSAVAIRQLQERVNTASDSPIYKWPEDFSLWELGTFDTESGYIHARMSEDDETPLQHKKLIVEADSLKQR